MALRFLNSGYFAGKVGIGTDNPDQKLQVEFANSDTSFSGGSGGDWGSEGIRIENTLNTVDTMAILHFRNNDADVHIASIRQGSNDSDLGFFFEGAEKVRFTNNGNVGIGTDNPDSKLELYEESTTAPTLVTLHTYSADTTPNGTQGSFIDFKKTDDNASFTPQARIGMLIKDSNGDQGIISEGCGNLVFHTSRGTDAAGAGEDVERMRITDIGNVGIGTTTPASKLELRREDSGDLLTFDRLGVDTGTIKVTSTYLAINTADGLSTIFNDGLLDVDFVVKTDNTDRVLFVEGSSGNVGIGTDTPGVLLHVQGISQTEVPAIRVGGYGNSSSTLELAETLSSGDMNYGFSFEQTGNGTNQLLIKRHNNSVTGAPVITLNRNDNNVSMSGGLSLALKATSSSTLSTDGGTTLTTKNYVDALTPGAGVFLPLAGGTMDASANINMNSGSLSSVDYIDFGIGQLNGVSTSNLILKSLGNITYNVDSNNNGNSSHIFQESGSELMRIRYDGNVGIGTTSPGVKLDVSGQIRSNDSFLLQSGTTAIGSIRNQGGALDIRGDSTRDVSLGSVTSPQALFVEGTNGNVGIGTTNPSAKLHIDGDLIITDTPQGQGDFLTVNPVSGKVTSVSSRDVSFGEAYISNYRSRVLDYGGTYFPTGAAGNVAKHKSNNLFNLMSMMLLPGGVFSGKVTAAKPKTGVDFTWTRTTVANYTNEEGVITEAPIATPRIDYANNSNGEILIEPTRTNLVPNSGPGDYGNSPGSSTTVPGPNGVYNSAIVPVPNANADRYQYSIAANTHSNGDVFTYSWYRRRVSTPSDTQYTGDLNIGGLVNCTLTGATTQIESNISGFDRFACQITLTLGNTEAIVRGYFGALIGTGNSSIAYFGQQLELGDFATTLINTTGSAVTRDNDYMIVNNLSDTIFEGMVGQGGMYMDFDYKREGDSDGLRFYDENNITPRVYLYQGVTGISDSWSAGAFTLNQTSGNKIGYMFTSTTSAVYCANGANVVTSSPTAAQALDTPLDTLYIDGNQNLVRIRELSMFTQMTSAQLVTLTTL